MIPSWDDGFVWWWEDAGRKMVVAAVTQAENARAGLGEDAGEEFRTDGDVGGWWIRWMGGKERVRMRKKEGIRGRMDVGEGITFGDELEGKQERGATRVMGNGQWAI